VPRGGQPASRWPASACSIAALLALLEPLTGTLLAALLLGDRLGATGIAGAVVLAAAVFLIARIRR
jgi:drug/metabolite transporter, DME family